MNRNELMRKLAPNSFGVEVGVLDGEFSDVILKCNPRKLLLIDAWLYFEEGYADPANVNQGGQDERYRRVVSRFANDQRVTISRSLSRADSLIPLLNGGIDWAYIDANHSEKECYEDMCFYSKYTSILALHDYLPENNELGFGVKQAVHRFINDYDWKLSEVTEEEFPTALLLKK